MVFLGNVTIVSVWFLIMCRKFEIRKTNLGYLVNDFPVVAIWSPPQKMQYWFRRYYNFRNAINCCVYCNNWDSERLAYSDGHDIRCQIDCYIFGFHYIDTDLLRLQSRQGRFAAGRLPNLTWQSGQTSRDIRDFQDVWNVARPRRFRQGFIYAKLTEKTTTNAYFQKKNCGV